MAMLDIIQTMGGAAGLLKFITPGESKDTKGAPKPKEEESGNMIMNFLKKLGGKDKTEAEKIQETAEAERAGIFTEAISSVLVRYFPICPKLPPSPAPDWTQSESEREIRKPTHGRTKSIISRP